MSAPSATREYELAARFLALPKERRKQLFERLQAQGIDLAVLPIPVSAPGPERERLSYAQERLWFLAQLDPDSAAYNVAGALRLRGTPDVAALSHALQAVVDRHEALRTSFTTEGGVARAHIQRELAVALEHSDARADYTRDGEACVQAWAVREALRPFDISQAPLVRARLVRFGDDDYGFFSCLHHIVADGWSLRLFIEEFAQHYAAFALGTPLALPPLAIQYADYAAWQRSWLEAGELEKQLAYFRRQLAGAPALLALPTDRPRPPEQSHRGGAVQFELSPALATAVRELARAHGVTLFMFGLAAFKALLAGVTGDTDICVGSSIANRNRIETEQLIGFFVNTQVLRSAVRPELSFLQLLAAVKQTALGAQSHQDLPFEQLAAELAPERSLAHNPLFQVHYDHQQRAYAALPALPGLACAPISPHERTTLFDLMLTTIEQSDGTIAANLEYATDLFEHATVVVLAQRYTQLLEQVVEAPARALAALDLGPELPRARPVEVAAEAPPPREFAPPANDIERALCAIWQDVLQVAEVSANANFFELGGDSIVSIQVVSRARELGIALRPKDVFQHQTVRRLAAIAKWAVPAAAELSEEAGELPLTPIQRAFFARELPSPQHFNQSLLLECRRPLDPAALDRALDAVVARHAALRTSFERAGSGWRQRVRPASDRGARRVLTVAHAGGRDEIEPLCDEQQRGLNLERGDVFRALYVRLPDGPGFLFLVAHHLVMDGVSFRILLDELERAYSGADLGLATSSFAAWAKKLASYPAASERDYWQNVLAHVPVLPRDFDPELEPVSVDGVQRVRVQLDRDDTERLLKHSGAAYRTQIQELLLAALSRAACDVFEQSSVGLWLEGHGREDVFDGVDPSRTIGWFTTEYPVVLTPEPEWGGAIKAIKEQLRAVPARGLGFGVLAWLGVDGTSEQLTAAQAARPRIAFNYLGQFDGAVSEHAPFRISTEPAGSEMAPDTPLAHWLEINGQVYAGELSLWIGFSPRMYRRETVACLAQRFERALIDVIEHCTAPGTRGATPSDFPLAKLEQSQLDQLTASRGDLADVYPVTPMQHGILFHALYDAEQGVYVTQLAVTIDGLEPARFRAAWERAIARHPILRTSFAWRELREPLQCVHAQASLAFETADLRASEDVEPDLHAFAAEQHRRGFDLEAAPLWRVALVQLAESRYHFVWTHHHLLLDGWSTARLLDEVLLDYLGRDVVTRTHAFADFVAWLARQDPEQAERFWRERLAAITEPTLLAGQDAPASAGVQLVRTRLSAADTRELGRVAQRHHVTLSTMVQAAWSLLLSKHLGQSRVVFGATTSGRPAELPGSEEMLGLFINTLPVVASAQPAAALRELWHALQQQNLAAREYEQVPLAKLQRWAGHGRGDLFDTLIVVENFPLDRALERDWQNLSVERVQALEITNYALTLAVRPGAELELDYGFDPARIAPAAVERIAEQVLGLLADFVRIAPDTPVGALSLRGVQAVQLGAEDLVAFEPVHRTVLRRIAERRDQAVDLVVGARARFSAAELERVASRIAHQLRELGVRAESRVGLYVERGPWLIAGALGIMRAGGAYVPLDPAYPRERLEWMLADAGVSIVLGTPGFPALANVRTLDIESFTQRALPLLPRSDEPRIEPQQLAYLIYTSGSTGTPKGVGVSHAALAMHARAVVALYENSEADCALHMASASFDASVEQWVVPLLGGARLVLSPDPPAAPHELLELLRRERVTVIYPPTSQIVALAQWLEQTGENYTFRVVCVGGEAVSRESAALIRRALSPQFLINGYGPTETVVTPLLWRATLDMPCDAAYAPIGHVVGDRSAYVLDADLNVLPRGVAGELYLGGAGMARGYLGRPALTAERFVPDPFSTRPGARSYRTGDRVRALPDGTIEYLSRIDHQIKLRGYRIELGEIEARLIAQPEVNDAVVVVRGDAASQRLVGYVASAAEDPAAELLARLRSELPSHMVPAQLVVLAQLPRTANGKIDRRALPAPQAVRAELRPARTALEREVLEIFAEVLGDRALGVTDDFFDRGGDSLSSLQLVSRLAARGYRVTLRDVFAQRTAEEIAVGLTPSGGDDPWTRIERVSREVPWHALSYAQERLWFLAQLDPGSSAYNISAGIRVRGKLQLDRLQRAMDALVARHEALRTSFEERDDRGVQRIHAAGTVQVQVRTLDASEARVRELFGAELARPFELARAPLVRTTLYRLEADHHVLQICLHHIIADGWSMRLLIDEFVRAYVADAPLEAPGELSYVDFAHWQRAWLASGELDRQLEYFHAHLGDEHPALTLPFDRPRPAAPSQQGATVDFALEPALSAEIAQLGRTLGASTFMLLLAAFEAVLFRLTGQSDLRVGVPMSNRGRLETESIVGMFVNTLVLRTRLDGTTEFTALLDRVKHAALGAQSHQDLPFERLVEALSPERSLNQNPLFQVMFDHQHAGMSPLRSLEGLTIEAFEGARRATPFDLTLNTVEEAGVISGSFIYATDLFDRTTITAIAARFQRVLAQVVRAPALRIAELELLDAQEKSALMAAAGPATPGAQFAERFVHLRIAAQAARRPDATALLSETGECWSYARLEQVSNQWAQRLRALGVGPEVCVGLCTSRSPRMIVGALAILKAGGAYVPLDATYPRERLRAMVRGAGIELILAERTQPMAAQLEAPRYAWLDTDDVGHLPASAPPVALASENLAYVVYTSGSTGQPKGVAITHAAVAGHIAAIGTDFGMREDDCALHTASMSFDVGVEQWMSPLTYGARIFVRGDAMWSTDQALDVLRANRVSWLQLPQGYLREVAQTALDRGERLHVRAASSIGEAIPRENLGVILDGIAPAPFINAYGPTETVITPTTWHVTDIAQCTTPYAPIGRVVGDRRAYVLDAEFNLVPRGVIGELYLGGVALARGYLDRPSLTAERFVPDPFVPELGRRMYQTGDLARVREDGSLEYLGRTDHQVKVRGFRIELGEVEQQLLAQPGVREAVVVAHGGPGATRLIGYVSGDLVISRLTQRLRTVLPEYMVPAQLVVLPALPRNENGKVDRKRLPAPDAQVREYAAPRNDVEAQLCAILAEVLGVERVGVTDNFFELGGDSIRGLQVLSRARKRGIELRPRDLFEQKTVSELAEVARAIEREPAAAMLERVPRTAELYQLSYAQERIWFLAQLDPDSAAYNIAAAVRLRGEFDLAALQRAVNALVQRHESLRTTFELREGAPWQRLHASLDVRVDARVVASDAEARVLVEASAHAPFDLTRGPLLRVAALRLSETEHVLSLVMHHIVSDGWSMELAFAELSGATPVPELPWQYVDYAHAQRQRLTDDELARQVTYWKTRLGTEHPLLALPYDRPRPAVQAFRGALVRRELDSALSAQLAAFASERGVTLFMLLLAAFQTLLHRLSGQRDIRVGVPVTNRDRTEIERMIGLFVNTQVLRSELAGEQQFSQLLAQVKHVALDARAHRDLPFERLVEALSPERSLSHNPLFQVTYNHASSSTAAPASRLELQTFGWEARSTQFDLSLDTEELPDRRITVAFTYATDLFDAETIETLALRYERILAQVLERPDARLAELEVLTGAERRAFAEQHAQSAGEPRTGAHVLARIAEHARATPDAIALECGTEQLTYAQLEAASAQLALRLRERGVGPEICVGVCLRRSVRAVLAPLAIWKAGGVYVPLDPKLPAKRLHAITEDAALALIVTEADFHDLGSGGSIALATLGGELAYVIYTSGSTGVPKGVAVEHTALAMHVAAIAESYGFESADCALQFASTSFDAGLEQWLAPLVCGARVVLRDDALWSAEECAAEVRARGVTRLDLTPGYLNELAQWLCARNETLQIRSVISGGEALPLASLPLLAAAFPSAQLINAYGPTEAVITPMTWQVEAEPAGVVSAYAPIGHVIGSRTSYVLDDALGLVPPGVAGELYLGGAILARGYLGRTALTAESFVPDPFSALPGARMYRTRDLVRRRRDGTIEYLGRADQQLKLRGYRIELAEIEAQLRAAPDVQEAVVVLRGEQLAGYVVGPVDLVGLRRRLAEVLPEYMLPSQLIALDALPRTAAGKIDRSRLPAVEHTARAYVAPRTNIEHKLANIWRDVLGLDRISVHDNFFELGGHSLLVMRVVSRVQADLGLTISVRQFFETSDLAELAAVLGSEVALAEGVAGALRELESMSDEQLAQLLAEVDLKDS